MKAQTKRSMNVTVMLALSTLLATAAGCSQTDDSGGDQGIQADTTVIDAPDAATVPDVNDTGSMADIDWESLPRLPEGKKFTTRYAAGVAMQDINPDHPTLMGGFGFCGGAEENCRKSEGIHDSVYSRVVAIADTVTGEVVMFAGVDNVGLLFYDDDLIHQGVQQR
ncbi:MAG: hypothetical protein GXP54_07965, partial [Deltaproteobacteria bacterium]|nr:hypothetical protein [Deltaproteobacteria bacterium]